MFKVCKRTIWLLSKSEEDMRPIRFGPNKRWLKSKVLAYLARLSRKAVGDGR